MKNLRQIRQNKGLTQTQLAMLLGVGQAVVARWELNYMNPSADKLQKLARILGCSIDELFDDAERAG